MLLYNPAKTILFYFFTGKCMWQELLMSLRCMTPTDPSSLQPCGILEPRKHISLVPSFHLLRERTHRWIQNKATVQHKLVLEPQQCSPRDCPNQHSSCLVTILIKPQALVSLQKTPNTYFIEVTHRAIAENHEVGCTIWGKKTELR